MTTLPVKTPTDGRPTRPNIDTTEYRRDQTSKKHRQTPTNTDNVFYFILPYRKRGSKREVSYFILPYRNNKVSKYSLIVLEKAPI